MEEKQHEQSQKPSVVEEINKQYTALATALGDTMFKLLVLEEDKKKIIDGMYACRAKLLESQKVGQ